MTKLNLTLNQAIAEYFDIDGRSIPTFNGAKPVVQAREWLESEKHDIEYIKREVSPTGGIVVYSRGGVPVFGVVDKPSDIPKGSLIHGSIVKKAKKTPKTSKNVEKAQNNDESDVNDETEK